MSYKAPRSSVIEGLPHSGVAVFKGKNDGGPMSTMPTWCAALREELDGYVVGSCKFENIDVSGNSLTAFDIIELVSMLEDSKASTQRLKAFKCSLEDDSIEVIAEWLDQLPPNATPKEIHLSHNSITTVGFQSLERALRNKWELGSWRLPVWLRIDNNSIDKSYIEDLVTNRFACLASEGACNAKQCRKVTTGWVPCLHMKLGTQQTGSSSHSKSTRDEAQWGEEEEAVRYLPKKNPNGFNTLKREGDDLWRVVDEAPGGQKRGCMYRYSKDWNDIDEGFRAEFNSTISGTDEGAWIRVLLSTVQEACRKTPGGTEARKKTANEITQGKPAEPKDAVEARRQTVATEERIKAAADLARREAMEARKKAVIEREARRKAATEEKAMQKRREAAIEEENETRRKEAVEARREAMEARKKAVVEEDARRKAAIEEKVMQKRRQAAIEEEEALEARRKAAIEEEEALEARRKATVQEELRKRTELAEAEIRLKKMIAAKEELEKAGATAAAEQRRKAADELEKAGALAAAEQRRKVAEEEAQKKAARMKSMFERHQNNIAMVANQKAMFARQGNVAQAANLKSMFDNFTTLFNQWNTGQAGLNTTDGQKMGQDTTLTSPWLRTQMCKYFQMGSCKYGSDCGFAHHATDLHTPVAEKMSIPNPGVQPHQMHPLQPGPVPLQTPHAAAHLASLRPQASTATGAQVTTGADLLAAIAAQNQQQASESLQAYTKANSESQVKDHLDRVRELLGSGQTVSESSGKKTLADTKASHEAGQSLTISSVDEAVERVQAQLEKKRGIAQGSTAKDDKTRDQCDKHDDQMETSSRRRTNRSLSRTKQRPAAQHDRQRSHRSRSRHGNRRDSSRQPRRSRKLDRSRSRSRKARSRSPKLSTNVSGAGARKAPSRSNDQVTESALLQERVHQLFAGMT